MSLQAMSTNDSSDIANQLTSKKNWTMEKKKWLCDRCGCVYFAKENFVQHMLMHTGPSVMPYKCEFCDLSFQLPCALKSHRRVHQKNPLTCEKCGKVFTRKQNYLGHMLIHEGKEPFKCELCGDEFPYKSLLKYHMRAHTGEHFACKICGKQFSYKGYLNYHMKSHCTNSNKTDKHCQKSNETLGTLAMHSQLDGDRDQCDCSICKTMPGKLEKVRMRPLPEHFGFLKIFSCTECNMKFYTVMSLKRHMESKHKVNDVKEYDHKDEISEIKRYQHIKTIEKQTRDGSKRREKKLFACDYMKCKSRFFSEEMLNTHKLIHTHRKKFTCGICSKELRKKRDLKTHMMVHSGKYDCEVCGAIFSRRGHLEEHKREHITQETHPYSCSHCDRSFKYELTLKAHMKCHLSICKYCYLEFTSEEDLESHLTVCKEANKCNVCDETFETKSLLESHLMLHNEMEHLACPLDPSASSRSDEKSQRITNEVKKIYKCGMCQISYLSPVRLAEHIKAKHEEGKFKCGHCDAAFRRKTHLEKHVMTHATRLEVSKSDLNSQLIITSKREKAYKCNMCDMSYLSKICLAEHINEKHKGDKFKCGHSDTAFRRKKELEKHVITHVMKSQSIEMSKECSKRKRKLPKFNPKKPFQCTICYLQFSTEAGLLYHQRLHNGLIQLTCRTCNAIFSIVEKYVNHQSSHGDFIKPFQCGFCDISFCKEEYFKFHLRTCERRKENATITTT